MFRCLFTFFFVLCFYFTPLQAQHHHHKGHVSPYAGLEKREIKSLSKADIDELKRGAGWGFALAAELNGMPGPLHVLELKDKLGLSSQQLDKIQDIFDKMKAEATTVGKRFIAAEKAIDKAFSSKQIDQEKLQVLINEAAAARANLRFIHLSRHLSTHSLLTDEQIEKYKILRGYSSDPCAKVPDGHNEEMWRRHNNCN